MSSHSSAVESHEGKDQIVEPIVAPQVANAVEEGADGGLKSNFIADGDEGNGQMEENTDHLTSTAPETDTETSIGTVLPTSFDEIDDSDLDVDSNVDSQDTDSSLGSDGGSIRSSTVSIRSSVYKYIEEHGRTYHSHNQGKYILPNDEDEQERLDLQHHIFLLTLGGKLHLAPISATPHNVLDIATGTGIWAIDFATQYPSASVTGTDLSPIQPLFVVPNCQFEVNDAEEQWNFRRKFDYIHARAILSCFRDPSFIVRSAFESLAPGGYLEIQDPQMPLQGFDDSFQGTALKKWSDCMTEGAALLGRPLTNSRYYKKWMQEAGFVDIQERHYYWGLSPWPRNSHQKMMAMWFQQDVLDGVHGMSMKLFTRALGWTEEEVQVFLVDVRKDIKNKRIHAYTDVLFIWGRKPE